MSAQMSLAASFVTRPLILLKQRHAEELAPYTEFKGLKIRWKVFSILLRSAVLGGRGEEVALVGGMLVANKSSPTISND